MMDIISWIFLGSSRLLAAWPYAGFAVAAVMISGQLVRTIRANEVLNRQWFRQSPVFTGLIWCIFNLYEMQMAAVMPNVSSATATFSMARLDLIVLTPLLYVLTAFAVYTLLTPTKD